MRKTWLLILLLWGAVVPFAWAQSLSEGMNGPEVLRLQKFLAEAGYLGREPEGEYGAATARAVALFQEDHGLPVTGVADEATQKRLRKEKGKDKREGGGVVLTRGNRGPEVASCQHRLIERKYLSGDADGVYGQDTEEAVRAFQRDEGLTPTGIVDAQTLEALKEDPGSEAPAQELAQGARGDEVRHLQKELQQAGYLAGSADGVYGSQTTAAVRSFQKDRGLSVTGRVDRKTWNALEKDGEDTSVLQQGSRGTQVALLQNLLTLHGFPPGAMDGVYGSRTVDSVKEFQRFLGMEPTGRADAALWTELHKEPVFRGEYRDMLNMRATAYTPYDSGGTGRTARGNIAGKGHAAVDPRVIPLGSLLFIEGYGYALADDIGGSVVGHVVDVGVDTLDQAYRWGSRWVNVYIVR